MEDRLEGVQEEPPRHRRDRPHLRPLRHRLPLPHRGAHDPNAQPDAVVLRYLPPLSSVEVITTAGGEKIYASRIETEEDRIIYYRGKRKKTLPLSEVDSTDDRKWRGRDHFLLGTDKFGRDILSRIIYGSRISLSIGFIAVFISISFGSLIGSVAGYFGGLADWLLMRFVDGVLAFPRLFLILIVIVVMEPSIFIIVAVLGLTGWMGTARQVRGQILSLKEQEFLMAAKAIGQRTVPILLRYLLPNSMAPIIVEATLRIGNTILVEAALSFLGLGVQPPTASWGNIIADGRDALLDAWWISTFPGIAIVVTVVAFNLIGDGLRDSLDPRLRD